MSVLAFDVGTKFIGVAIFLPPDNFLPIKTVNYNNNLNSLIHHLTNLASEYSNIKCIVIGKPSYPQMHRFIKEKIMPIIKHAFNNKPILWINEDLSTQEAQSLIILENSLTNLPRQKKRKAKQHGIIDSASALILLQRAYEKNLIPCN